MSKSKKRQYWLGGDRVSGQDTFFLEALDSELWEAGTEENWDACWSIDMPKRAMFKQLDGKKTINHIPGNNALTIKSNLAKTLSKAKERVAGLPQEARYSFFPDTYSMPEDYFRFQEVAAQNPDWLWIQKPKNLSRGRGIEVVQHPEAVPMDSEWIIQRYLSEPHLWDGYKYVLRCYVLITSAEPLRFYWYHEGFAKKTSEPYSTDDLSNAYCHLTNPDINEHNTDVEVPVVFHSFKHYREWLKSEGADDQKLFDELHDLIALTVIAARESFRSQSSKVGNDVDGAYELIGLDCMVDSDLKPWVLECNLSPSLATCSTTGEEANEETIIKSQLVSDIVNMLGLNESNRPTNLSEQEKAAFELEHAGGFNCVFPTENANDYLNCFPIPRYADVKNLPSGVEVDFSKLATQAPEGVEAIFPESLALLYGANSEEQQFIFPNELATMIWLQNSSGLNPNEIANELSDISDASTSDDANDALVKEVWDVLADWSQAKLFVPNDAAELDKAQSSPEQAWSTSLELEFANTDIKIRSACAIAGAYLNSFFSDFETSKNQRNTLAIDILRSQYGYVLISASTVIAGSQKLSMLIPKILEFIAQHSLADDEIAQVQGLVASMGEKRALFVSNSSQLDTWLNDFAFNNDGLSILSGAPTLCSEANCTKTSNYPLFISPTESSSNSSNTIIAERNDEAYQLQSCQAQSSGSNTSQSIKVDYVIYVELHTDAEKMSNEEPIQALRNAEVLATLWENSLHRHKQAAALLPTWLEEVQGIKVNLLNDDDGKADIAPSLRALMGM